MCRAFTTPSHVFDRILRMRSWNVFFTHAHASYIDWRSSLPHAPSKIGNKGQASMGTRLRPTYQLLIVFSLLATLFAWRCYLSKAGVWSKLNTSALSQAPDPQCSEPVCSNFAPNSSCAKATTTARLEPAGESITPTCRFQNGTSKPKYLLRSYPGSGNTWVRQVLEKVTGICTGDDELHILHSGWCVAVYNTRFCLL